MFFDGVRKVFVLSAGAGAAKISAAIPTKTNPRTRPA